MTHLATNSHLRNLTTAALAALLACSLPACSSGGGDSGGAAGGGPGGGSGERYHLFLDGLPGSATLNLVDPASPSSPITVNGSTGIAYSFNPVFSGTIDVANASFQDLQVDRLILTDGNRLLSLPLSLDSGAAALEEIFDFGAPVGEVIASRDLSVSSDTVSFVVEVGGAEQYQVLELTGSSITGPDPFPGTPVSPVGSGADGSFQGWVALESGMLTLVARDLSVTNLTAATSAVLIDVTNARDGFFSLADGFGIVRSDLSYVDVSFTPAAAGSFDLDEFAVVGEDAMYFASPTGAGSFEVVRALPDGSAAAITGDLMGAPTFLNVTPSRVLCGFAGVADETLLSFDLLGGDEQTLESGVTSIEYGAYVSPGIQPERIVYSVPELGVVDVASNGAGRQVFSDSTVAGLSFETTLSFGNALSVSSVFLSSPAPMGGTSLTSMTPGDASSRVEVGVIPPGFTTVSAAGLFTSTVIITAIDAGQSDVFVATEGSAGSLRRVTDTPTRFELGAL